METETVLKILTFIMVTAKWFFPGIGSRLGRKLTHVARRAPLILKVHWRLPIILFLFTFRIVVVLWLLSFLWSKEPADQGFVAMCALFALFSTDFGEVLKEVQQKHNEARWKAANEKEKEAPPPRNP